jgi:hypothetical protein
LIDTYFFIVLIIISTRGELMKKKHYICTHTWSNPDTIKDIVKQQGEMTDAEFFAGLKTEKAETLQHWMGKDDFFFCHWYAEDEQSIIDVLEKVGLNDIIVTMPSEMQRYVSSDKITNEKLVNPFDI